MSNERPVIEYIDPQPFVEGDEITPWGMIRRKVMTLAELEAIYHPKHPAKNRG